MIEPDQPPIHQPTPSTFNRVELPLLSAGVALLAIAVFLFIRFHVGLDGVPADELMAQVGAPDAAAIWDGAWWGLVTSTLVHVDPIHLLGNLSWLCTLGFIVERRLGRAAWIGLFLLSSVVASGAQLAVSDQTGIGASGVVFAWAGFAWAVRRVDSPLAAAIEGQKAWLVFWLILCFAASRFGGWNVGNAAHLAGLVFGVVAGRAWAGEADGVPARLLVVVLASASVVPVFYMPWSARYWYERGTREWQRDDVIAARDALDRAVAADASDADAWYQRARLRRSTGDLDGAAEDLTTVTQLVPKFGGAWYERSRVRHQQGRVDDAIADLTECLRRGPRWEAIYDRAFYRQKAGEDELALKDYADFLALREGESKYRAYAHRNRARLLENQGRLAEGLPELDGALAAVEDAPTLLDRARLRARLGNPSGAEEDQRRVLVVAGTDVEGLRHRLTARELLGDAEGAVLDAVRAVELAPTDPAAARGLGFARFMTGDLPAALAAYSRSFELEASSRAAMLRGIIAWLLGDRASALQLEETAVALGPDDPYAAVWLAAFGGSAEHLTRHATAEGWAAVLAEFGRGGLSKEEFLSAASRAEGRLGVQEQLCEAHAFLGISAEAEGDPDRARAHYRSCVDTKIFNYIEYQWSQARLRALEGR